MSIRFPFRSLPSQFCVAACFAFLLAGCAANFYERGQNAFTAGSQLRNAERADAFYPGYAAALADLYGNPAEAPTGQAESQFAQAREQLTKALRKPDRLRRDGLLGNTHLLLGLTEFQLGNYPAARQQAIAARTVFAEAQTTPETDGGRDLALAYALEELIVFEQLADSIEILVGLPVVQAADSNRTTLAIASFYDRRLLDEEPGDLLAALDGIDFARAKATASPETVLYLLNTQMAALQNARTLLDRYLIVGQRSFTFRRRGQALADRFHRAEARLNEIVDTYRRELLTTAPDGENDPAYRMWRGRVF